MTTEPPQQPLPWDSLYSPELGSPCVCTTHLERLSETIASSLAPPSEFPVRSHDPTAPHPSVSDTYSPSWYLVSPQFPVAHSTPLFIGSPKSQADTAALQKHVTHWPGIHVLTLLGVWIPVNSGTFLQ